MEPWPSSLRRLGQRSNVLCKLSGMVTEADWQRYTESDLQAYIATCLEAFGLARCMACSDWPVCLPASQYRGLRQLKSKPASTRFDSGPLA